MMLVFSLAVGLLVAPPVCPGAGRRIGCMRMSYSGERTELGTHIASLELRCEAGEGSACTMLDQLAGYAKALEDLDERRVRAPDAPVIQNELMLDVDATLAAAPVSPSKGAGSATKVASTSKGGGSATSVVADPSSVAGALVKLFDALDSDASGVITLKSFQASWLAGRTGGYTTGSRRDAKWEARQAAAGSRRISRLFSSSAAGNRGKVSRDEFVTTLKGEYDKRMERGLSDSRAVAEITSNMPQRALFAEMYGSE